jgi:hypothetical protein
MTLGEQLEGPLELLAPPLGRSIQMEKQLIEEISDGVATLPFNRPDRLNALSTPIMEGLLEALPRLALGCRRRKGLTTLLAERHARHLAGRAQTLQDARKPMHTDPSTI